MRYMEELTLNDIPLAIGPIHLDRNAVILEEAMSRASRSGLSSSRTLGDNRAPKEAEKYFFELASKLRSHHMPNLRRISHRTNRHLSVFRNI